MDKYEKQYIIKSYECDVQLKLRIRSLFNLFQDMADEHADKMGLGYHYCHERGIGWIGGGYHVEIKKLPTWGDEIRVTTWPSGSTAATGIRDFQVRDGVGNILINATSQWVLVDINRMRPIPVMKHIPSYELLDEHAMVSSFDKISIPEGEAEIISFPVHTDDIDLNAHVNNALYPSWILDTVSDSFSAQHSPSEIRIDFKRPAKRGDIVRIKTYRQALITVHVFGNADDSVEFARVCVRWS